jgi:hypothetical protein
MSLSVRKSVRDELKKKLSVIHTNIILNVHEPTCSIHSFIQVLYLYIVHSIYKLSGYDISMRVYLCARPIMTHKIKKIVK